MGGDPADAARGERRLGSGDGPERAHRVLRAGNAGGVRGRADDDEAVVHHRNPLDAEALLDELPFGGGGVPSLRAPMSSTCSPTGISQGVASVHHIKVDTSPEGGRRSLVAGASMMTLATLLAS